MKNRIWIWVITVLLFTILICIVLIYLGNWLESMFGSASNWPMAFLAELLANFIIVFVGFMLVNVYWTKIQEEKKHKDKDKFFRDLLQTLKTSVDKANELMKVNYQSKKDVTERDQLFKNEWEKVKSLATIINEFVASNHDISSWTFKGWTFFITEIKPEVDRSSKEISDGEIRALALEIPAWLRRISEKTQQLMENIQQWEQANK